MARILSRALQPRGDSIMNRFASFLTAATFAAMMALPCGAFAQTGGSSGVAGNAGAAGGSAMPNEGVNTSGNPSAPGSNGSVTGPGMGDAYKSGPSYGPRNSAEGKTATNPTYNANGSTGMSNNSSSGSKTGSGY
jgi:hypothetical protein